MWKLPIAAAILAAFPVVAFLYQKRVAPGTLRTLVRVLAPLLWVGAVAMVVWGWATAPHPIPGLEAHVPPQYAWVRLHPTPAIHHLYANATFLGFYLVAMSTVLWGRSASRRLSEWVGSKRVVDITSGVLFAASIVSKALF